MERQGLETDYQVQRAQRGKQLNLKLKTWDLKKEKKKKNKTKTWDLNNENSHKEKNEQEEMGIGPALGKGRGEVDKFIFRQVPSEHLLNCEHLYSEYDQQIKMCDQY